MVGYILDPIGVGQRWSLCPNFVNVNMTEMSISVLTSLTELWKRSRKKRWSQCRMFILPKFPRSFYITVGLDISDGGSPFSRSEHFLNTALMVTMVCAFAIRSLKKRWVCVIRVGRNAGQVQEVPPSMNAKTVPIDRWKALTPSAEKLVNLRCFFNMCQWLVTFDGFTFPINK